MARQSSAGHLCQRLCVPMSSRNSEGHRGMCPQTCLDPTMLQPPMGSLASRPHRPLLLDRAAWEGAVHQQLQAASAGFENKLP